MQNNQALKTNQNDKSTEQNMKSFVTEIVSVLIKKLDTIILSMCTNLD